MSQLDTGFRDLPPTPLFFIVDLVDCLSLAPSAAGQCILAFTDQEAGRRHIESSGRKNLKIIAARHAQAVRDLLELARMMGAMHCRVDPESETEAVMNIAEFLEPVAA